MKLIHLSDLHLGKRVNEYSMLEDQEYILIKILEIIDNEKPDGVIIAGDVYDKAIPPAEAVQLFDSFLCRLKKRNLEVFIISGNHDSAERLAFGNKLMDMSGIHISPVFDGKMEKFTLKDEYGNLNIYLLPFIKPIVARHIYNNEDISTFQDAVEYAVKTADIDKSERNIIVTHQFVTGALRSDSEEQLTVGGTENVDASVFDDFDYVALGHIHRPQSCGKDTVRYSGTPLKYSFSEANHKKSVTVVTLEEKGNVQIDTVPLVPKRDLREIKGNFQDIIKKENYEKGNTDDYMHITLTDEEDVFDAFAKLSVIYKNIMKLDYDNKRTRSNNVVGSAGDIKEKSPFELFSEFYEKQNNQPLTEVQEDIIKNLIDEVRGEEK